MIDADLFNLIFNGGAVNSAAPGRGASIYSTSVSLRAQLLTPSAKMDLVDEALRQSVASKLMSLADAGTAINEHAAVRVEKLFDDLAVAGAVRSINVALGEPDSCELVEQAAGIAGGAADALLDGAEGVLSSFSTAISGYTSGDSSLAQFIALLASLGAQASAVANDLLNEIDAELVRLEAMYQKHQALSRAFIAQQLAQDDCARAVLQRLGSPQLKAILDLAG